MQVWVERPEIDGETVTFRWSQSLPNPFQVSNEFFYRYEGLDLSRYSTELFYEIFLALQLRVFTGYDEEVELHFPSPVPAYSVQYWQAHHHADNVTIEPVSPVGAYAPWADEPALIGGPKKAAVFFGGGKDSTLVTCLLSEIYGADEVMLLQFVGPLLNKPSLAEFLDERQERIMLRPAAEHFGVATQRGWTNYQAIFRKEGYHLRPHLEFYTVGALPALLAWGVEMCVFTVPWSVFAVWPGKDNDSTYRYITSRPEALAGQSRHYAATLGQPLEVLNLGLPFHALVAHTMLARRYPDALDHMVSCTLAAPDKRWCNNCTKCALFAVMSLSTNTPASDFDYNAFWSDSSFVKKMIALADEGAELDTLGNVRWTPSFPGGVRSYIQVCHMFATLDLGALPVELSPKAFEHLAIVAAMFGNRRFPEWETIPRVTIDALGPELGPKIMAIVAEHIEIVDHIPGPNMSRNKPVSYQFAERLPLPTLALEHVRRPIDRLAIAKEADSR